ncbi:MAG: carboxypeptidase-like regulatory domain-containing protein [Planctomycetota bacterium]
MDDSDRPSQALASERAPAADPDELESAKARRVALATVAPSEPLTTESLTIEDEPNATLRVQVVRDDGVPMPDLTIDVRDSTGADVAQALEASQPGTYVVERLPLGTFEVRVTDLPDGVLPPRSQQGMYGPRLVELLEGENELTLEVVRGARVFGRILGPDGALQRDAHARFALVDERDDRAYLRAELCDAGETGWYEALLYPGTWLASPQRHRAPNLPPLPPDALKPPPADFDAPPPAPTPCTVTAGSSLQLDLGWRVGPATLTLTVVDEQGAPFAGAKVLVHRERVTDPDTGRSFDLGLGVVTKALVTDRSGRARASGLELATYSVVVEPEGYFPFAAPGKSVIGARPLATRIDVAATEAAVTVTRLRAHPVAIEGRFRTAAPVGVHVQVVLEANPTRPQDRVEDVQLGADGSFRLWVERNEGGATFVVSSGATTSATPVSWDRERELLTPVQVSLALGAR